ncbi:MAG TPA: hypothetical protein VIK78_19685 [Ruminiclostridium sp.]
METKPTNIRLEPEDKTMATAQAKSIGLTLTEYTRMLYHLDLSELVKKAVEKARKENK